MATRSIPSGRRQARRPTPGRSRLPLVAAALVGVAVLLVAVWALGRGGDESAGTEDAANDPGVAHVHGLGVDPADGTLYVATHTGMFRVPEEGEARRVGDSFQDTMGFTVVGDGRFLGSGHPDVAGAQAGQPGRLGLIESTDAGETWQSLSLSGEADFHGLSFVHDRVYGWDAGTGRFLVSADLETWDTRSTLDLYGFAVDPADPDHIVGATPTGLTTSTDGGRQWVAVDEGPSLVVLAWDQASGLWGVDVGGQVHHSADGGDTWQQAGSLPGPPQALLATADALYAAADEGGVTGIYESTDDGNTWTLRYRDGD